MRRVFVDDYGITDVGKERTTNEDQFLVAGLNKGMLVQQTSLDIDDQTQLTGGFQGKVFCVADGVGGRAAGERASQLAVHTITRYLLNTMPWFFRLDQQLEDDVVDELVAAIERCEEVVVAEGAEDPAKQGMGTTLTLAYLLWPRLYVVHAGDSRAYLQRNGKLQQLTNDQSVAQQLVDQGLMPAAAADGTRWANVLHSVISAGGSATLEPIVYKARVEDGDTLLLCTDGLTKHVSDERIARTLAETPSAEGAVRALVAAANDDGGSDNVTAVVARFRLPNASAEDTSAKERKA